jgi:hypothetical protein
MAGRQMGFKSSEGYQKEKHLKDIIYEKIR